MSVEALQVRESVNEAVRSYDQEIAWAMVDWSLSRARVRAWRSILAWGLPWTVAVIGSILDKGGLQFLYIGLALGVGGTFGNRLKLVMPVKIKLMDIFSWRSTAELNWSEIPSSVSRRDFAKIVRRTEMRGFWPRNQDALRWALGQNDNLGRYPALLILDPTFCDAGVNEWVALRTDGALEMAITLARLPQVQTLDELVRLIHRLGKNTPRPPAPAS